MDNFLDAIIQQANYLRTVVGSDNIDPEIAPEVLDLVKQAESAIDDACSMHNDFVAGTLER